MLQYATRRKKKEEARREKKEEERRRRRRKRRRRKKKKKEESAREGSLGRGNNDVLVEIIIKKSRYALREGGFLRKVVRRKWDF